MRVVLLTGKGGVGKTSLAVATALGSAAHGRRTFLLSTDFFQNGMREDRPLQYVTFYFPYKSPCYNPLVRRS